MKNIKIELPILITMIFALIVTGLFFLQPNIEKAIFSQESQNGNLGEILKGTEIVQEIPANKRRISSIGVMFGTYMRVNSSDIDYSLYSDRECKNLLYESKIKATSIEDNKYKALKIDYDTSNYDKLYLKITTPNASSGNAITIWNNKAKLPNVLWKNNENNGSACIKVNEIRKLYIPNYLKIILVVLILSGSLILCLLCFQRKEIYYDYVMYFYMAFVMFLCFYWSVMQQFDYAPDEYMRILLPNFIFNYNKLPIATDNEVRVGKVAKMTYAYYATWFPSFISVVFMKIASVFTMEKQTMLYATRFASVAASGATTYFVCKISQKIFCEKPLQWIFILLCTFLPQFIFLGSYVNNDIFAVLASAIIFYSWLQLENTNWSSFKYATLLSAGMIIAILSYYNSYMWVVCSCFLFCHSLWRNKNNIEEKNMKMIIKIGSYIAILTTVLTLPFFIRNIYLYHELFGLKNFGREFERFLIDNNLPLAPKFREGTIFNIKFWKAWVVLTVHSFFADFGYMSFSFHSASIYNFFYYVCGIGLFCNFLKKSGKKFTCNIPLNISLLVCAVVPICLSAYFSWNVILQPQGRYIYPGLLPIAYFITMGLFSIPEGKYKNIVCTIISIVLILLTTLCGTNLILNTVQI